jgi:hypothetical protein
MIKYLAKGVVSAIAVNLLTNYRRLSVHLLKIEIAKSYLHGVKAARSSALGLMALGLVIGLICVGLVLFHVGLFVLLPWHLKAKAILGVVLGLAYVAFGALALQWAMRERTWMEKSGAAEMVREAVARAKKD